MVFRQRAARGVDERFAGRVELGCGHTACAYRARDTERGIDVVLKVASLQFVDVETSRGWLESECLALKSLQASSDGTEASERRSGRIIQCYEDHTKESTPFIVLESWGTQTLERYFRAWVGSEKRMPARIAQSLWTQIQEGLAYMSDRSHTCQWIHGDLHFKNIMVDTSNQDEPTLKIIDFGLASTEQEGDEERQPCKDAQTVAQTWRSWFEVKPHHVGLDPADTKEKSTNMFGLLEACAGDPTLCPAPAHWLTTAMALEGTADVRPPPSTRVFQSPLEKAGYCPK
uniref:Protein kinase domain-containing protein n=1 Tax=Zooxanthella nutricula TaxID=1333877 RepID=A0A7S2P0M1_9DINO